MEVNVKVVRDLRLAEIVVKCESSLSILKSLKWCFVSDFGGNIVARLLNCGRRSEGRSLASNPVMHPAVTTCMTHDGS